MTRMTIGRYRNARPAASAAMLKRESLPAFMANSLAPLPLVGRGWGWGCYHGSVCGLPPSLTLPHRGGGKRTERARRENASSRALQLPPLQAVVQQQRCEQENQQYHRDGGCNRPVLV